MLRAAVISLSLFCANASYATNQTADPDLEACVRLLTSGEPAQGGFWGRRPRGPVRRPTAAVELRREYLRGDLILVAVTYTFNPNARMGGYGLTINSPGIPGDRAKEFGELLDQDVKASAPQAGVYAYAGDDEPRSQVPRHFGIASGYRHPLNQDEAIRFFLMIDGILRRRLDDHQVRNVIQSPELNPAKKF